MMGDFSAFHTLVPHAEREPAPESMCSCDEDPVQTESGTASSGDSGDGAARRPAPARSQCAARPAGVPSAGISDLESLLAATAGGDRAAFEDLYRLTSRRLFAVLIRMAPDRAEAEELLQDTYTTAWHRAASFDCSRGSALTWLITLARNRAIDKLRRPREHPLDETLMATLRDCAPAPDAIAEAHESCSTLEAAMRRLSPQQHRAIRSAFFGGLSYSELADTLGVPQGTVKSWIRRGLAQLRIYLDT